MAKNKERVFPVQVIDRINQKLNRITALADAIGMGTIVYSRDVGTDTGGWRDNSLYELSEAIAEVTSSAKKDANKLWELFVEEKAVTVRDK